MNLLFSSVFILEEVKDEICKAEGKPTEKHNGRSCFSFDFRCIRKILLFLRYTCFLH